MANFEPKWDLIADSNSIKEGQTTYFRLRLSKNTTSTNDEYILDADQYLELVFDISGTGETLDNTDFIVSIGESMSTLVNIENANTGTDSIQGTHTVKISKKDFQLSSSVLYLDSYLFKIECPQDGVWDGPESLTFNINSISEITLTDEQISNTTSSGVIGISTQILNYNTVDEVWVTPDLVTHGTNLYTIGGIGFGADSRLFIQAFGQSQNIGGVTNVFMPAYSFESISSSELPTQNITSSSTRLLPSSTGEEITINIIDTAGASVQTGLRFNANGQIVQTFIYDSEPIDAYFKAKIISIKSLYATQSDAYYVGKRFRAYQTWVAPDDVSAFSTQPTAKHLYQLKDTKVYPYVVKDVVVDGVTKILFEEDKWYDLGLYNEALGSNMIGKERIFRIIVNDITGTDLVFDTDPNLGEIHVGEYFGHTVYPKIVASGSELVTYEIDSESSPDDLIKYGMDVSADGYLIGTAYAQSSDFTANDDIPLEFDVIATGKNGKSLSQRFKLRIVRGLGENYLHADIYPSLLLERSWFKMISTSAFSTAQYYRGSDPRYGITKIPRILLKENLVNPNNTWNGLKQTMTELRNGIIDTVSGAPTPTGSFNMVLGNYKVRSALDNLGNVIYDVLYREVHPSGTIVNLSLNPRSYTDYSVAIISEIFGLRQNIFNLVGEDTRNLLTDPTDLSNRGIVVEAIDGISVQMLDTVPRYMNHPYIEDNIEAMYFPGIVVAYLQPGQGEVLFNTLIQNNEHGTLLNAEFTVAGVEFKYHVEGNGRYVEDTFIAPLKVPNLFQ